MNQADQAEENDEVETPPVVIVTTDDTDDFDPDPPFEQTFEPVSEGSIYAPCLTLIQTGNAQFSPGNLQFSSGEDDDFDFAGSTIEFSPEAVADCIQTVNQAAAASG